VADIEYGEMRSRLGETPEDLGSRARLRRQFWLALAASVVAGGAMGFSLGARTGVRPAIEAAMRAEGAKPARADSASAAQAPVAGGGEELANLTAELQSLRAQMEQMRHVAETQRAAERLKALEASQSSAQEALQALEKTAAANAARLDEIDRRLARAERPGVDFTPVGAIGRSDRAPPRRKRTTRKPR
jgi:hypothetical protein